MLRLSQGVNPIDNWHGYALGLFHTICGRFSSKAAIIIPLGGDSAYGPVFKEIGERVGPFDPALLGIGAYAPREMMRASHATPEEAVQMGRDLGAHRIVGMHWGTSRLTAGATFRATRTLSRSRARGGV